MDGDEDTADEVSSDKTNCFRGLSPEGKEEDSLVAFLTAVLNKELRVLALEAVI